MQQLVSEFIEKHSLDCDAEKRYIDLVSEVGELGKELLKATDYGNQPLETNAHTETELGDCLFSLLALCDKLGVDSQRALDKAILKYQDRFEQKGDISSGE